MKDLKNRPKENDIVHPSDLEMDWLDHVAAKPIGEAELHKRLAKMKYLPKKNCYSSLGKKKYDRNGGENADR